MSFKNLWWRADSRCRGGGYWCATVPVNGRARKRSFGPDKEVAEKLLAEYMQAIESGADPNLTYSNTAIADIYSAFLEVEETRVNRKEIKRREFQDRRRFLDHFCAAVGSETLCMKLGPRDFTAYWHTLNKQFSADTVNKRVYVVRRLWEFAADEDLIEHPMKFGSVFKRAGRDAMEKTRAGQIAKRAPYTSRQIRRLIRKAPQPLKSMILLGINCAFGPGDCAALTFDKIKLNVMRDDTGKVIKAGGWHTMSRVKNQKIERVCPLWPETVLALEEWTRIRQQPLQRKQRIGRKAIDDTNSGLVFITLHGRPYVRTKVTEKGETIDIDSINPEFRQLCRSLGLPTGFYRLRHTCATWLDQANDPSAEARIRGHKLPGMKRVYVHKVERKRLKTIVRMLRRKLFKRKRPAAETSSASNVARVEPAQVLTDTARGAGS